MKHAQRCQLAELVTAGLQHAGVRAHTAPWVWMAQLFGPVFERDVPLERPTRTERRAGGLIWVTLLPLVTASLVVVTPIEIWRWLRARRHHAKMMAKLPLLGETSSTYRNAPALEAGDSVATLVHSASEVVCFDFRIESEGRAVFFGTAAGVFHQGEPAMIWLDGRRAPPPKDAMDAHTLAARLNSLRSTPPAVEHWVWQLSDPYELTEREQRPW